MRDEGRPPNATRTPEEVILHATGYIEVDEGIEVCSSVLPASEATRCSKVNENSFTSTDNATEGDDSHVNASRAAGLLCSR